MQKKLKIANLQTKTRPQTVSDFTLQGLDLWWGFRHLGTEVDGSTNFFDSISVRVLYCIASTIIVVI